MATATDNFSIISSSTLQPSSPMVVPPVAPDTTNYGGIVGGVTDSVAKTYDSLKSLQDQGETTQSGVGTDILSIMQQFSGKEADVQAANESAGVNEATKDVNKYVTQLADLNAEASRLNREAQAIPIQVQQENIGTGATDRGVAPITTARLRENALKALSIGQQSDVAAAALTGSQIRRAMAVDKAQQMIDLKYKPLEAKLAIKQKQYDMNKDVLLSIDKKRAEALGVALQKEKDELAEKKANEKAISDMIVNAATANAPADKMTAAKNAKTPAEAAMILGEYAGNYYQTQLLKAQIANQKAETAKKNAELKAANDASATVAGSTTAQNWVAQFNSGAMSLEDIYTKIGSSKNAEKLKNEVAAIIAAQGGKRKYGADDASIQAINSQIKNVNDLLDGGVGSIVGIVQGGMGVVPDSLNVYKQNALAVAKNLVSNQTLQALADAKSKGVTFGALSEGELTLVADAASRISAKIKKDKDGNIIGFTGSQSQFEKDLKKIKEGLEASIVGKTGIVVPPPTASNPFSQAMGMSTQAIPGTAIINKVSDDGSIDFTLPK